MARYIPTKADLARKVNLVEITVTGEFIGRIDEKRKTSYPYKIQVLVPEKFNGSDIKRLTAKALLHDEKYPNFIAMRTWSHDGKSKKTDQKIVRSELYSQRELERFDKVRREIEKNARDEVKERGRAGIGIAEDTSDYGDDGLPPLIE